MSDHTPRSVAWYRSPIDTKVLKKLHERSDLLGLLQASSHLGVLCLTGAAVAFAAGRFPWPVVVLLIFVHAVGYSFVPNAVHELCHGTVFKSKFLNALFIKVFCFLGWFNPEMFEASHARHHRYTLHPPDDLEVVLPIRLMVRHFFLQGFLNYGKAYKFFKDTIRIARGRFCGQWELTYLPESAVDARRRATNWARTLLMGHGLIIVVSVYFKLWLLPILTTLAPFYGGWLSFLCNQSQHIGLQDNVPDFRLCCRTFVPNPLVRFLYWHMNYHTEHHMYAAVPCYRLGRVHALIKHDLPPCPQGVIATWMQIAEIQKMQKVDPAYQYVAPLPPTGGLHDRRGSNVDVLPAPVEQPSPGSQSV